METDLNKIINQLKKDFITNISVIGFLENNEITEIIELNNSYLIKGLSDVEWTYIVCNNPDELKALLEKSVSSNLYLLSLR